MSKTNNTKYDDVASVASQRTFDVVIATYIYHLHVCVTNTHAHTHGLMGKRKKAKNIGARRPQTRHVARPICINYSWK